MVFLDVNETLLDLEVMRSTISELLDGRSDLTTLWFSKMLHYSLVSTATDNYESFGVIGVNALIMVAEANQISLDKEKAKSEIINALRSLPAHPDVIEGLKILKSKGYTLVTLTNSSYTGVVTQLKNAGLTPYIDDQLSIESIKTYKPHLEAYQWALKEMNIPAKNAIMVAAHGWDIAGAGAAGLNTAFINRPGKVLYPTAEKPDYNKMSLIDIANDLEIVN